MLSTLLSIISNSPILSLIAIFTLAIGSLIVKLFYTHDSRFLELRKLIPGPPQLPLLGNTFELLGSPEEILSKFTLWTQQYGPRMIYRIGNYWILTLAGSKDLEKLLTSTSEIHKSIDYDQLIPWLGEGLLTSNGKKWMQRRKLLTGAFHFKILNEFIEIFNEQSMLLVNIFKNEFTHDEHTNIVPYFTRCTLEIICETAMGVKINAQMDRDSEYIQALERVKELQLYRGLRPWLENRFIWDIFSYGLDEKRSIKVLHDFTNKVIRERKSTFLKQNESTTNENLKKSESISSKGKGRLALLDLMFEAQITSSTFTDEGIREETDTFMFGGHDTTSTAVSFTLFHIGNNPDVQEKLHREMDEVFGDDRSRHVTSEDLTKLKYLECCIKESMRLTSPIPIVARSILNDFELDTGIILPKDTLMMIFLFQLHRDANVFENPLEYKPERFSPENSAARHPFSFLAFSAGSRNCIGQKFAMMEAKILLANIFRNMKVKSAEKLEDLVLMANIILSSKNGIKVSITPR